jgi:probable HAF family extracellular repeat protein
MPALRIEYLSRTTPLADVQRDVRFSVYFSRIRLQRRAVLSHPAPHLSSPTLSSYLFVLIFLILVTQPVTGQVYQMTDLGTLGGSNTFARGINNRGEVVGDSEFKEGVPVRHAFLFSNGILKDLTPALTNTVGPSSFAFGINNLGIVVGAARTSGCFLGPCAVMWRGGTMTDMGMGGHESYATGVNDAGQIVFWNFGRHPTNVAFWNSFLWENGSVTFLQGGFFNETSGINNKRQVIGQGGHNTSIWENGAWRSVGTLSGEFCCSVARGINDSTQVVGDSPAGNNSRHAFLYNDSIKKISDLGTLGGTNSFARSINNLGQVVGYSEITPGDVKNTHAFLYNNGPMIDLNRRVVNNPAGWELIEANGINDAGQIVVNGKRNGEFHAFLLTPVNNFVLPNHGGNTGFVTVKITGPDLQPGATVKLTSLEQPDIFAVSTVALDHAGETVIQATFDLRGSIPGKRDVVVSFNNSNIVLPNGFTIEPGLTSNPTGYIIRRPTVNVGPGRSSIDHVFVVVDNPGNVNAEITSVTITYPQADSHRVTPRFSITGGDTRFTSNGNVVMPMYVSLPPGATQILPFDVVNTCEDKPVNFEVHIGIPRTLLEAAECIGAIGHVILGLTRPPSLVSCLVSLNSVRESLFDSTPKSAFLITSAILGAICDCGGSAVPQLTLFCQLVKGFNLGANIAKALDSCFPLNNTVHPSSQSINCVRPIDPNEKVGPMGVGMARYISPAGLVPYVISFENLEAATAPAQEVIVTDQLDLGKLELDTFSLGPILFGNKVVTPPAGLHQFTTEVDLRPAKDLLVRIDVGLNRSTGLLTWRFTSIDPNTGDFPEDPLVGFLPPNRNSPEGQGSMFFTVMPKPGVTTGTEIRNKATIFFNGEPLDTPVWLNTIDVTKPVSHVLTLTEVQNSTTFDVKWSGTDEGSGIGHYTIYVSDNGGPFTPWLTQTTSTQAVFAGVADHTYSFFSVARDLTNNLENAKIAAETTTRVVSNRSPIAKAKNITVAAGTSCQARVSPKDFDDGSLDPDGDEVTLTLTPAGPFNLGSHAVVLTSTDIHGASDSVNATLTVVDQTAPTITNVSANPSFIWPPNRRMVDVVVSYDTADQCGQTTSRLSVSSNEPLESSDVEIVDAHHLRLRADRRGAGNGRTYKVTIFVMDRHGNLSSKDVLIGVPHDQRKQ